jgi:hypothetical protein
VTLKKTFYTATAAGLALAATPFALTAQAQNQPSRSSGASAASHRPQPVTLFGGSQADVARHWDGSWKVENGALVSGGGELTTKQRFRDFQLHIEWKPPVLPANVRGQARGNSGVFLQGLYEIQVLDSFDVPRPGKGDAGAVYNQAAPLLDAYKPPTEWQTYDIAFRAARADASGKVTEPARVTVFLNGFVIQNNQVINGPTAGPGDADRIALGPIRLQDHGNPVRFRNIKILPLPEEGSTGY